MERVIMDWNKEGCWVWLGTYDKYGYGQTNINVKTELAHRVSYMIHNQVKLDSSQFVIHSCDFPACVNPAHLRIGTHQENMDDMKSKNRQSKGSHRPSCRYTEEQVLQVVELHKQGFSQFAISRKLKVGSHFVRTYWLVCIISWDLVCNIK